MKLRTKSLLSVLFVALSFCLTQPAKLRAQLVAPGRVNVLITITTSGTPVQVTTNTQLVVDRLFIQSVKGNSGTGVEYICTVPSGTTPSSKCSGSGQLAGEINSGSATSAGQSYSDTTPTSGTAGIFMGQYWVDSDTSGNKVIVSYNVR